MKHLHYILLFLLLLSFWALLSIEVPVIPKIEIPTSAKIAEGVNKIFLGLSYSYIVGVLVFYLTVILPDYQESYRLQPVIDKQIDDIGTALSKTLWGFPSQTEDDDLYAVDIFDTDKTEKILKSADWNSPNLIPIYSNFPDKSLKCTFYYDYIEVQKFANNLIKLYSKYLDTDKVIQLEAIKNPEFMTYLDILRNTQFPQGGQNHIVEGFIEVLKAYKKLSPNRNRDEDKL